MASDLSVFGAATVFGLKTPRKLERLLIGAGHHCANLFGTGNDRGRRNRLEARALCDNLARVIAEAQVRQTRLPLTQSLTIGGDVALVGNCPLTTGGLAFGRCVERPAALVPGIQTWQSKDAREELDFLASRCF